MNLKLYELGLRLGCIAKCTGASKGVLIDLARFLEEVLDEPLALKSSIVLIRRLLVRGVIREELYRFYTSIVKEIQYEKSPRSKLITILRVAIEFYDAMGRDKLDVSKCMSLTLDNAVDMFLRR